MEKTKIFDAHFHIIDSRFPLVANNGYLPPEFNVANYQTATSDFEIIGGAIVSGSFQAFDQEYLKNSLKILGNKYCGVANIQHQMDDAELEILDQSNVVAVRFNLKRGGSETIEHLDKLSNKLFEKFGWHTELYVDSKNLSQLKTKLQSLKNFSIDHLGLSKEGLNDLYYWVEKGVRVKATGFGRIDFDPILAMKKIYQINPAALMFGTDLPSTRADIPFSKLDIELVKSHFNKDEQERIFYKNALEWYRI